jgi:phosphatidylserine/phosphatidylglycerophosphate/cardiolipin synthase-like enzyme
VSADLSDVPTSTLEKLREAIASRRAPMPLTEVALLGLGIRHSAVQAVLMGHSTEACLTILEVALAERARGTRNAPELVWTGPERQHATARDTSIVLRSLFEGAREQVILAGYSFERGFSLLEPLHRAMQARPLDVRFFIDVKQPDQGRVPPAEEQVRTFLEKAWSFPGAPPRIYYDRRALDPGPPWSSLHAKCVVVDGERALVSSANFSLRAQEHNIETGVLLDDPAFAHHLARQWLGLIEAGLVVEHVPEALSPLS